MKTQLKKIGIFLSLIFITHFGFGQAVPIIHYSLDGNVNGSVSGNQTGTNVQSLPTYGFDNKKNGAFALNGKGSHITIPSNSVNLSQSGTFSVWIKPDINSKDQAQRVVLDTRTPSLNSSLVVYYDFRNSQFEVGTKGNTDHFSTNLPLEQWHHFVVTVDASTNLVATYLNCNKLTKITPNNFRAFNYTQGTPIKLGARADLFSLNFWDGEIDEFKYFDKQLTQIEIDSLCSDTVFCKPIIERDTVYLTDTVVIRDTVFVDDLGINQKSNVGDLKMWLNSSKKELNFQYSGFNTPSEIVIYSLSGEKILESDWKETISVATIETGMYIATVKYSDSETLIGKKFVLTD